VAHRSGRECKSTCSDFGRFVEGGCGDCSKRMADGSVGDWDGGRSWDVTSSGGSVGW
jgi:hypothetical protein